MNRLKLMETYATVVDLGSFTHAAGGLGVSRAVVSKRVKELEAALGIKLLNRNTHALSVTAAGADYYESCKALLTEHAALDDRMQARKADPGGLLRIRVSKTFGEAILSPVVAEFCRLYPKISVQLMLSHWDMSSQGDLIPSGCDISIRNLPARDTSLVARAIVTLPRVLVATPEYLEAHGRPRNPQDLIHHNCLYPRSTASSNWEFDGPNGRESVRVTGFPRANSSFTIRHAVRHHLGIASLIEYLAISDIGSGRLVRVLEPYQPLARKLYVLYQKDTFQPLRTRIFIDFLVKRMKEFSMDVESIRPDRKTTKKTNNRKFKKIQN